MNQDKIHTPLLLLLMLLAANASAQLTDAVSGIAVVGVVSNRADGNPLPFCDIHFMRDGGVVAVSRTDTAGTYSLNNLPAGEYKLVVTQFADTLMYCKSLQLHSDSRIRCLVNPPQFSSHTFLNEKHVDIDGSIWLRTININTPGSTLKKMGLLITSSNDPRLWDFSGKMGSARHAAISIPLDEYGNYDVSIAHLPNTLREFLTFGKKLYYSPPIWELCPDTMTPKPKEKNTSSESNPEDTESREQTKPQQLGVSAK